MLVLVVCSITAEASFANPTKNYKAETAWNSDLENVVKKRLETINLPLEPRFTPSVRAGIKRYVSNGYRDSEYILGRTSMYFPIFEHYLRINKLPISLRYLPLIESALKPEAKPPVGAAGLWQFVPATAKEYGLTINDWVDERLDPHKSSAAATKMLAKLYEEFQDWGIVLAAYNCGPGRVRSILRRHREIKDFWGLQRYLPRESQHYVPRYLAAAYLINYYQAHNLNPRYPDYDLQETRTFKVYNYLNLSQVAKTCNIPYNDLVRLNPAYARRAIPTSRQGQFLVVPAKSVGAIRQHYSEKLGLQKPDSDRIRTHYTAVPGDDLHALALLFNCTEEDIMAWNGLRDPEIVVHQNLIIYLNSTERA